MYYYTECTVQHLNFFFYGWGDIMIGAFFDLSFYTLFDSTIENSTFRVVFLKEIWYRLDVENRTRDRLQPLRYLCATPQIPCIYCIWTHVPYKNVHCTPITAICQIIQSPNWVPPLLRTAIAVLKIWLFPLNCWPINLQKKTCYRPFWRIWKTFKYITIINIYLIIFFILSSCAVLDLLRMIRIFKCPAID